MKILRVCSGLFVAIALLTSCATQRINQFSTFADAGKDYSDAVIVLTDQASRAAIDADSAVLLQARKKSKEDRIQQIGDHTKSLEDLIKAMRVLREHTLLLKRYFLASLPVASIWQAEHRKAVPSHWPFWAQVMLPLQTSIPVHTSPSVPHAAVSVLLF